MASSYYFTGFTGYFPTFDPPVHAESEAGRAILALFDADEFEGVPRPFLLDLQVGTTDAGTLLLGIEPDDDALDKNADEPALIEPEGMVVWLKAIRAALPEDTLFEGKIDWFGNDRDDVGVIYIAKEGVEAVPAHVSVQMMPPSWERGRR